MHINFTKLIYSSILATALCISNFGIGAENTATSSQVIKKIEGVYKERFENALVSGEKYQSEDIIEIVPYSADSIYFRISLQFYNGHSCGIYGIAKYSENTFIYRSGDEQTEQRICTLKISADEKALRITDRLTQTSASTCSAYCGARGSLGKYDVSLDKKRKIRYMPIILKSRQYTEAVDEHKKQANSK
ncbi:hypothetical protein [Undibacterium baiyunense]|uniref:Tissue inhibitor of metalloproteinase n=1 Tax=Undibacterium baiyunense TaxID=2828731 RepID=A0A941I360_9BURK|nr:hypothetical protein [Undibacterium baiyunense]MBR7747082.1 hypothetical protein [Undibacterium baiyunense]